MRRIPRSTTVRNVLATSTGVTNTSAPGSFITSTIAAFFGKPLIWNDAGDAWAGFGYLRYNAIRVGISNVPVSSYTYTITLRDSGGNLLASSGSQTGTVIDGLSTFTWEHNLDEVDDDFIWVYLQTNITVSTVTYCMAMVNTAV